MKNNQINIILIGIIILVVGLLGRFEGLGG